MLLAPADNRRTVLLLEDSATLWGEGCQRHVADVWTTDGPVAASAFWLASACVAPVKDLAHTVRQCDPAMLHGICSSFFAMICSCDSPSPFRWGDS
jgi:hypothetical protein